MGPPRISRLQDRFFDSVEFSLNPRNFGWLRLVVGIAALGYTVVALHGLVFRLPGLTDRLQELATALLAALAFVIFRRQPLLASILTLVAVWCEVTGTLLRTGQLTGAAILVYPLLVTASGLVFGGRRAITMAAASGVAIPLVVFLHRELHHDPAGFTVTESHILFVEEFILAGSGLLTWSVLRGHKKALDESEQLRRRYSDLFENAPDGLVALGSDGRVADINLAATRLLGLEREGLHGAPFSVLLVRAGVTTGIDWRTARPGPIEIQVVPPGAAVRFLEVSVSLDAGADGSTMLVLRDITAQHQAAEALRQSERSYREIFNAANDAIFVHDAATGALLDVNDRMLEMFGYATREELRGGLAHAEPLSGGPPYTDAEAQRRLRQAVEEGPQVFDWRGRRKEGSLFWNEVSLRRATINGARCVLAVVRDVTERKDLEEQLRQAQKMDAVGQLAGGVAHDFNNILAGFMLNLGLMESEDGLAPRLRAALKEMGEQAKLAAALTRRLLLFSRRQVMETRPINIIELLGELAEMLHRLLGEAYQLTIDHDDRPLWIEADAGMIGQMVMNLCLNARDAMAGGGPISIRLREMTITDADFPRHPQATAGQFARLEVIDTGCGMTEATIKRLFEPFFTTKDPSKGTGLGLAIAYGVVQQHRGWIEVQSAERRGSTFSVYLPVCEGPVDRGVPAPRPPAAPGRERVLVVEDEPAVRAVIKRVLERLGYRVFEAESGPAARRLWDEKNGEIDLLLTDMGLPGGMTGLDLAESLIVRKPNLKIIIASGYNTELVTERPDKLIGAVYLGKPFEIETLTTTVRQCLDAKVAGSG